MNPIIDSFEHAQVIAPKIDSPSVQPHYYFNPAVFSVNGRFAMVFRSVIGEGKRTLMTCWLNDALLPVPTSIKSIDNELSVGSDWHADPRVYWIAGRLFMVFNNGMPRDGSGNDQWVVELNQESLKPVGIPRKLVLSGMQRRKIEKNWQFFAPGNNPTEVLIVYSINPHVILQAVNLLTEENGPVLCVPRYVSRKLGWYFYPEMRGGTPPLLVDDKYWSFFHYIKKGLNRKKTYFAGWYCFDAQPPFKATERSVKPIICANNPPLLPQLNKTVTAVVYPAGAVFDGRFRKWYISYGLNDEAMRIVVLKHDFLARTGSTADV